MLPYLHASRDRNRVFPQQYTLARHGVFARKFQSALEELPRHVAAGESEIHDETFHDPHFQRGHVQKTPFLPGSRARLQDREYPAPFGVEILHRLQEGRDAVGVGPHSFEHDGFASDRLADSLLRRAEFRADDAAQNQFVDPCPVQILIFEMRFLDSVGVVLFASLVAL